MALFRQRIALEACPAKTAESVSYAATFIVLGGLIVSNYSRIADSEQEFQSAAPTAPTQSTLTAQSNPGPNQPITFGAGIELQQWSEETSLRAGSFAQSNSRSETELVTASPESWRADLQPIAQIEGEAPRRAFPTIEWEITRSEAEQSFADYNSDPGLPLLRIDPLFLLGSENNFASPSSDKQVAGNDIDSTQPIHEITVTGAELDRLRSRPDNIPRLQIPRPYRADQIQRSFVLPPRIQALRP